VDGREIVPAEHPVFPMGRQTALEVVGKDDLKRAVAVDVARPKGKKLHFVEPTLVQARHLEDGLGYLKVAMFPGMVGVEVANEISRGVDELGEINSLIIDLRGNIGGGIGALRVMSLLTPGRIPVGFALPKSRVTPNLDSEKQQFRRFGNIPSSKKALWSLALQFAPAMLTKSPIVPQTEELGGKAFHGRVSLLVDRHTASAAEMIVAFARENNLAKIVGEKTAGRLLSATSVKVGQGFRLALPTGVYYTWKGTVLEGTPIEPDERIDFDYGVRVNLHCGAQFACRMMGLEIKNGMSGGFDAENATTKCCIIDLRKSERTSIAIYGHILSKHLEHRDMLLPPGSNSG
jgi:carboxyl-terminal processing protease